MIVLNVCAGIDVGRQVFKDLGITVDQYFSSEIDPQCISVSKNNHDDIIYLGDVNKINLDDLPSIDLLIGGPNCQSFSSLGNGKGFEDPRADLIYRFAEIKNRFPNCKFLMENVRFNKVDKSRVDNLLGVNGQVINSALFSPQSRTRTYWTNIPLPALKTTLDPRVIDDIRDHFNTETSSDRSHWEYVELENKPNSKFGVELIGGFISPTATLWNGNLRQQMRVYDSRGKSPCMITLPFGFIKFPDDLRCLNSIEFERLQGLPDNYTAGFGKTVRRRMLGNAWQADTIGFILSQLV